MSAALDVQMDFLNDEDIQKLRPLFRGNPTENRFLIATPIVDKTKSGLFVVKDSTEIPKKGVVIQRGLISEENQSYTDIKVGDIITYGQYAGKEIDLPYLGLSGHTLTIITLNEVVYSEKQTSQK